MEKMKSWLKRMKPFIAVIVMQVGLSGMDVLSKAALNQGMSNYVLVVYRHAIATVVIAPFALLLDKKVRPKMTGSIFLKIIALSLLEPVIDQNLYFLGMKYTTATFAAAIVNILPAVTFVMAWIVGLEKVRIKTLHSQAKIVGTIATVAGAMVMTAVKGPAVNLFGVNGNSYHGGGSSAVSLHDTIKGALLITIGCFSWAGFVILQAITLKTYPTELSLTAWICLFGTIEGGIVAMVMERGNNSVWALHWDTKLLAAVYTGVVCSGFAYYIQGVIMKDRGPVFVTAFNPLSMVIVAVMSSIILAEQMFLGRVIGAIIIVGGLYLVVWGKSKDHKYPSLTDDDQTIPTKQTSDTANHEKQNFNQENLQIEISNTANRGKQNSDQENHQI
ncbi:WAT1-related protein At2g37460-like [Mercurialis annua]|uniref:WAT1-related protein At2g37460-like n=1 Tax=Mercurialis annua TaxID=3986 RepID=UPI002160359F|nr:WAT1-related protein At2g37460-like [Mercurialis annua]